MTFDFFVLPFFLGLNALVVILAVKYARWIRGFEVRDKLLLRRGLWSRKSLNAAGEVFMESLLHRKMFRRNALLGFMHMSFALGWFLLIVSGNLESRIYSKVHLNPPYYPIFLKFFVQDERVLQHELMSIPGVFRILMDALLLLVLSGLTLALVKRAKSNWFGLKKASEHSLSDRLAITCLWLIFPLRLLAESFTAARHHGGSFLTNTTGDLLAGFLPAEQLAYPAWWAYSWALGLFFISLPWSRFMHIPTEVVLIFLRHYGIRPKHFFTSYANFEIQSCPKCGVCIDACPVGQMEGKGIPPAYFLRALRNGQPALSDTFDCLLCGRCKEFCPVDIHINDMRISQRVRNSVGMNGSFMYIQPQHSPPARVAYFAGCMTHLTPTVKIAMEKIFAAAKTDYQFLDRDGSICCGRPLWMAGKTKQAQELVRKNRRLIESSGCDTLVLSCPICLKIFKEEYNLEMEVLHHSQYILRLAEAGTISLNPGLSRVVFHDPCELGRGCGIYNEPRELLAKIADIVPAENERKFSMCCGGSLGSTGTSSSKRDEVTMLALESLLAHNPDAIVTACPLCKKTFQKDSPVRVLDLSEMVTAALNEEKAGKSEKEALRPAKIPVEIPAG
jgi:Fe-S oxidoreductase